MEISILNQLILGLIQGVFEWLPISSSAFVSLFANNVLGINNVGELVQLALFFHLGTFFAAFVYFRKDVSEILFNWKTKQKKTFNFLLISFIFSAIIGFSLLMLISEFSDSLNLTGKIINLVIAGLLILTAMVGFSSKVRGLKKERNLSTKDGIVLGIAQALAIIPGISRSGITVSSFLLRKFDDTTALKLSFLMSLPIVFFGNIILNIKDIVAGNLPIFGLISAFIFGILTIHLLIKLSKKINFNWFVLIFGILMIVAGIIS